MCSKATCRKCGKITWSGCGMHVKQVMSGVPSEKQCTCHSKAPKPAAAAPAAVAPKKGRLSALFRR